jgi:predicted regulator of Ras-like GTPase activity (Roadblock/LC7/MglB family)
MALMGTLADLGVVDLVQFPHAGRKTGELIVAGPEREARLYYAGGKLVHASSGGLRGIDALVDVVDWTQGEFEFRPAVEPPETSIELELHRAVMLALKTRDERKAEEERKRAAEDESERTKRAAEAQLGARLAAFVGGAPWALHACVIGRDGAVLAEASGEDGAPPEAARLCTALHALLDTYPRPGLRRALVEDALGTVVLGSLGEHRAVAVVAAREASVGAVSMAVSKLAATLAGGGA